MSYVVVSISIGVMFYLVYGVWFCSQVQWNYCILDEGHVIKNSKTKVCTTATLCLLLYSQQ